MAIWPWSWTRRRLLRHLDTNVVEQAIRRAERRSSGEIVVSVAGFFWGDLRALAEPAFVRLGVGTTRHRNGVLILVAPSRRKFVILGDEAIHAHVGEPFWATIRDTLEKKFRSHDFTAGLVEAIDRIGDELAQHFPPDPPHAGGDMNEIPDTVDVTRGG